MTRRRNAMLGLVIVAAICLAVVVSAAVYDELSVLRRVF